LDKIASSWSLQHGKNEQRLVPLMDGYRVAQTMINGEQAGGAIGVQTLKVQLT